MHEHVMAHTLIKRIVDRPRRAHAIHVADASIVWPPPLPQARQGRGDRYFGPCYTSLRLTDSAATVMRPADVLRSQARAAPRAGWSSQCSTTTARRGPAGEQGGCSCAATPGFRAYYKNAQAPKDNRAREGLRGDVAWIDAEA